MPPNVEDTTDSPAIVLPSGVTACAALPNVLGSGSEPNGVKSAA
jgi:hypothetical protein